MCLIIYESNNYPSYIVLNHHTYLVGADTDQQKLRSSYFCLFSFEHHQSSFACTHFSSLNFDHISGNKMQAKTYAIIEYNIFKDHSYPLFISAHYI